MVLLYRYVDTVVERGNPSRAPPSEEGGGLYFSSNQIKIFEICNEKLYY